MLAVGINGHWRLPLAYFLTDGTSADLQNSLLRTVISNLYECGCIAVSVTLDGLSANQRTLQNLGCSLDVDNIVSVFAHHDDNDVSVAAIFDAVHMMKLATNCFREYKIINIPRNSKAKWHHIHLLHEKQSAEELTLANKLIKAHLNF